MLYDIFMISRYWLNVTTKKACMHVFEPIENKIGDRFVCKLMIVVTKINKN